MYVGFGLGLAALVWLKLKKTKPWVEPKDITYDPCEKKIFLDIENKSKEPVYVKPAIRKIVFASPSEWRDDKTNLTYMSGSRNSVIKNFELIGEYASPIRIERGERKRIEYPVRWDAGIDFFDNIRVDCKCGNDPKKLEGTACNTLQVKPQAKDLKISDEKPLKLTPIEEGGDGEVISFEVRKTSMPVEAKCSGCGVEKWLHWVVSDMHLCDECGSIFLGKRDEPALEEDVLDEEVDFELVLDVDGKNIMLNDRQSDILDLLDVEDQLTSKQIAEKIGCSHATVGKELRNLNRLGIVDRVKVRNKFKYFSLRDRDKIMIYDEELVDEENSMWT
ncbi:MAG TPA: ArsR family transcriptional regulator [Candidatus Altiarchaeales archaeon]|nr:ArsR family transcriptional regulator [Candidatus Altiarchaeales archaeon]